MVPYFPVTKKDNFQIVLHSMAEFFEVESKNETEILTKLGEYYKVQLYNARLFLLTLKLFVFAVPGTGKSCLQFAAAFEVLKNYNIYDGVIIATTPALVESMHQQALCKCTDGSFLTRKGGEQLPNERFKSLFSIISHGDLIKKASNKINASSKFIGKTVAELNEVFGGKILQIDELSRLLKIKFTTEKHGNDTQYTINEIGFLSRYTNINQFDNPEIKDCPLEYVQVFRIVQCVRNLRFMGLTGTPIPNHPPEFFMLANLFLELHEQYNLVEIGNNILNITLNDFRRLNGSITYIGDAPSMAIQNFIGTTFDYTHLFSNSIAIKSKLVLKTTEIFGAQAEKVFSMNQNSENSILLSSSSMYSYVAMNGTTGEDADLGGNQGEIVINTRFLKPTNLERVDVQMKTSALFTEILYKESIYSRQEIKGCFYVYNSLTKVSNKSFIKLGKIYGFEVLTKDDLKPSEKRKGNYCDSESVRIDRIMTPSYSGKSRIIFISEEEDAINPVIREEILKVMGSEENVNGDLIRGIVGSKVFLMGVSIGNTDRMYRIYPEWNETAEEQSRKRVIRTNSHIFKKDFLSKHYGREIFPHVDFTYFCPYGEYFFIEKQNDIQYVNQNCLVENVPCLGVRIHSETLCPIIGFCKVGELRNNPNKIIGNPYFVYYTDGESPFTKISNLGFNLVYDLNLLGDEEYDIIYSNCGIIKAMNSSDQSIDEFTQQNMILIDTFRKDIKLMMIPGNYSGSLAICPCPDEIKLIPLIKKVVSNYFYTYMTLERKSFISRKMLRFAKQISADCISNIKRNILPPTYDYTASCDYDVCKYVCASEIFTDEQDPTIKETIDKSDPVKENELFWNNKEIIYSKELVNECKNQIIGILNEKYEEKISSIYRYLSKFREYFIGTSIYELIRDKVIIIDRFGFECFICVNKEKIFLKRFNSTGFIENSHIDDLNSFVGTLSNHTIEKIDLDSGIVEQIENMSYTSEDQGNLLFKQLLSKVSYTTYHKLIESALIREVTNTSLPCDKIIKTYFAKYLYYLQIKGEYYHVHIHPLEDDKKTNQSNKIAFSKLKKARYLDFDLKWKDADNAFIDDIKNGVKNEYQELINFKARIYTVIMTPSGLMEGPFEKSPYYITREIKNGIVIEKFNNENQFKVGGGMTIKNINSKDKILEALFYFRERVDFNKYIPNLFHNIESLLINHQGVSLKELKLKFVEIIYALNLDISIDTEFDETD
jgi:hypothetical protein